FAGAMGKSAQVPFHVWLPDAMEGPTPVSALIHAATMVAAGVYLTARVFPLFAAADPAALSFVTAVGLVTAVLGATVAVVQTDIKRVLAYSTISQLGFMMLALGAGAVTAAMFHLTTHAFFKALLFLGAGSVIHGTDTQDIRRMGGLLRTMPVTAGTFLLASLALAGLPPLSGFFSKDEVMAAIWAGTNPAVYAVAAATAILSAFYMARLCFLVFFGEPRDHLIHAHESPAVMTGPLVALAIPAALGGLIALPLFGGLVGLPGGYGAFVFHREPEPFHLNAGIALISFGGAMTGIMLATGFYLTRHWSPTAVTRRLGPIPAILEHKYGFDALYQWVINKVVLVAGEFIAAFDRIVINDGGINGPGRVTMLAGYWLKFTQTGKLSTYAFAMVMGVLMLAGAMAWVIRP
ncbi:MAG: proton-conducting transporter membrane subunit, partial [Chloroflexi bacterium]|nr:proton-conducting transporter membrane subunit [Chloroflexota bacterium]